MSSRKPLPTISELVKAYHDGIRGTLDKREDYHSGSVFDVWGGTAAVLFSRQAQRDRDLFRATYFGEADGADLTNLVFNRYQITRYVDALGAGTMLVQRPNASAGAGTFYAGTRIAVYGLTGRTDPLVFEVTTDTAVASGATTTTVPVNSTTPGPGQGIANGTPATVGIRIDDITWDPTWQVASITCGDGTLFELAPQFRARVLSTRTQARVGYRTAIKNALLNVGAAHVALFASNFGGAASDYGMNVAYVGDENYTGTTTLVRAGTAALEAFRIAGADLSVLPMAKGILSISAAVSLWDDPSRFPIDDLRAAMTAQAVNYFAPEAAGFAYRLDALAAAMSSGLQAVQSISFVQPLSSLTVMSGTPPVFPNTLTKWFLSPSNVTIAFSPPQ